MSDEFADALGLPTEDDIEDGSVGELEESIVEEAGVLETSEQPQEEPAVAAAEQPRGEDEVSRQVKGLIAELQEERRKRQEAEGVREKLFTALQSQVDAEKAAEEEASLPNKDDDPVGHIMARMERRFKSLEESAGKRRTEDDDRRKQEEHAKAFQEASHQTGSLEQEFVKEHPDYFEALEHSRSVRRKAMKRSNPGATDQQIETVVRQGDQLAALNALQRGENPAEWAYNYTVEVFGWKPKQGATEASGTHTPETEGSTPSPATRPSSTSLSMAHGSRGASGRKITQDNFDELSDAEIDLIANDPKLLATLESGNAVYL